MNSLQKKLTPKKAAVPSRPILFDAAKAQHRARLEKLLASNKHITVHDHYRDQLEELFMLENPVLMRNPKEAAEQTERYIKNLEKAAPLYQQGQWVSFPWLNSVVHILSEKDFFRVRTSRNCYLINPEEQEQFYNSTIGIGGLSIGSSVALALVLQGGAKYLRLADFDRLALSNTNRIRAGVHQLGHLKAEITARQIYEINPYAEVEIFTDGITPANIKTFVHGLDVVIDELDNLSVKLLLRKEAKHAKLPVVMGADNGDTAVVDIERYDQSPLPEFFHDRMGPVTVEQLGKLDKFGIGKKIAGHIGLENHTERMLTSLSEMGKSIVSWPQLGGAALLNGSAVAYCVRKILTHQPLESNRAIVSLDEKFDPDYGTASAKRQREHVATTFKKIFGL